MDTSITKEKKRKARAPEKAIAAKLEDLPQEDEDDVIYIKMVSKRKRRKNSRTTAKEPDEILESGRCEKDSDCPFLPLLSRSPSPEIRAFGLPVAYTAQESTSKKRRITRGKWARKGENNDQLGEVLLNDEDRLSRTPFDCLIQIFGHFTREELMRMLRVNRTLNRAAKHRLLYRGKSAPFGCLSTSQLANGYSFMLSTYDKTDVKTPGLKTFSYKLQVADTGETKEDKNVVAGRNLYATRLLHSLHNMPVPDLFCDEMSYVINKFAPPNVVFSRVRIDADFLDTIASSVFDVPNCFIEHSTCDDNTNNSFIKFVKSLGIIDLTIVGCPQMHYNSLFSVPFLTKMQQKSTLKNLRTFEHWETYHNNIFHVSNSMIPSIVRYETLILPSMTVNVHWIGALLMAFLDSHEPGWNPVYWNIGLDRMPETNEIEHQIANNPLFEYKLKRNGTHRLKKQSNGFLALFNVVPIEVNEGNSLLFLLDIAFVDMDLELSTRSSYQLCLALNASGADAAAKRGDYRLRSHLDTISTRYVPNLLTALASQQPSTFFVSESTVQSIKGLVDLERSERSKVNERRKITKKRKSRSALFKAALGKYRHTANMYRK